MKMYDKFGCVLRIETVINDPREFKVRRSGKRKGEIVTDWFPMGKGVAQMPRYREVCMAATRRYLEALAVVPGPQQAEAADSKYRPASSNRNSQPSCSEPASKDDIDLLAACE